MNNADITDPQFRQAVEAIDSGDINVLENLLTTNPGLVKDTAKRMVWSDNIFVMIMTPDKFRSFATKPIADTKNNLANLFALSIESLDRVNDLQIMVFLKVG